MKKSSYTLRYYIHQLGRLRACTVFSAIFAVLGFPLMTTAQLLIEHSKEYDNISSPMLATSAICIIGMVAMSYITPIITLKHLYTKVEADNILSLPLTANQRFIGDSGALLTSYHLPLALSALASFIIETVLSNRFGTGFDYYGFDIVQTTLCIFMFIAFNTAIITCCGRLAEAIIYPLGINIVLPLMMLFGSEISYRNVIGLYYDAHNAVLDSLIFRLTPFGAFYLTTSSYPVFVYAIVMAVVYMGLAFIGYKLRRAENIGKPFVFKYAYLILSTLVALTLIVCYVSLCRYIGVSDKVIEPVELIPLLIFLLIVMLIMEIVQKKRLKKFPRFFIRYAATFIVGVGLCGLLYLSKGFGTESYIPSANDIEYASINCTYLLPESQETGTTVRNNIFAEDKTAVEMIRKEHKYALSQALDGESEDDDVYIDIQYYLKDGRTVERYYSADETTENFWSDMYASEAYRTNILTEVEHRIERYNFEKSTALMITDQHNKNPLYEAEINEKLYDELTEALKADLRNDTEYGRHDEYSLCVVSLGDYREYFDNSIFDYVTEFYSTLSIPIYEGYTNTIALLSRYMTVPTMEESLMNSVKNCEVFTLCRFKVSDKCYDTGDMYMIYEKEFVFITAEEFMELTQNSIKYNNGSPDGYQYAVFRGIDPTLGGYKDIHNYVPALKEIGIERDNYDFLDDGEVYYEENSIDNYLNTELNSEYREIFESRTVFRTGEYEENGVSTWY